MKTLFNNVLKSTSVAIVLLASVFTLTASAATVEMNPGSINPDIKKVIVKGNTQVVMIQDKRDYITVDDLDLAKVSLHQIGNTLTINSSETNAVTVYVHVKDIYRIHASDKARVRTSGKFLTQYLQVIVKDDARARIKATTESLYTLVSQQANLELLGNTAKHICTTEGIATVNTEKFAALITENVPAEKAIAFNNSKNADTISK